MNLINDKYVIITSLQEGYISDLNTLYELVEVINKAVNVSVGVDDKDKLVRLNQAGQIDPSMIDVSTFYYVGPFTPEASNEYPDTTGETSGAFWVVEALTAEYIFTGGDLAGEGVDNGDFMVWGTSGWSIMRGEMSPLLYYKLDGTQPITGPFAGGGQQFKNAADGVDDTDLVTLQQLQSFAPTGALENDIVTNITVGGIPAGTTLPAGTTFESIFNQILVTLIMPFIKAYESVSVSWDISNSIIEVGEHIVGTMSTSIGDGLIKNGDGSPDTSLKGGHDVPVYSGNGIDPVSGAIDTYVSHGSNNYSSTVHFLEGTSPYYDSEGNEQHNLDADRNAESHVKSKLLEGVYPQFYGMSAEDYLTNPNGFYGVLTKDVSITVLGWKTFNISGSDQYIYFILPAAYKIIKVLDGNDFDVTSSFVAEIHMVTTPNYATNFYIMKSISLTSVSGQDYKINIATA